MIFHNTKRNQIMDETIGHLYDFLLDEFQNDKLNFFSSVGSWQDPFAKKCVGHNLKYGIVS